jgi:hypothetical protein
MPKIQKVILEVIVVIAQIILHFIMIMNEIIQSNAHDYLL